eukprot:2667939-Amphidinium_carterae.2
MNSASSATQIASERTTFWLNRFLSWPGSAAGCSQRLERSKQLRDLPYLTFYHPAMLPTRSSNHGLSP